MTPGRSTAQPDRPPTHGPRLARASGLVQPPGKGRTRRSGCSHWPRSDRTVSSRPSARRQTTQARLKQIASAEIPSRIGHQLARRGPAPRAESRANAPRAIRQHADHARPGTARLARRRHDPLSVRPGDQPEQHHDALERHRDRRADGHRRARRGQRASSSSRARSARTARPSSSSTAAATIRSTDR